MKRNGRLITKILEEFEEHSRYETKSVVDSYHIDVLARAGWVDADITRDANGRAVEANIKMILKPGYDALDNMRKYRAEQERQSEPERNEDGLTEIDQKEVDLAYKNICEGDVRYEKALWLLVSGSTTLSLLFGQWYISKDGFGGNVKDLMPVVWAVVFWAATMISLVLSHVFSTFAHKNLIHRIYDHKRRVKTANGWSNAVQVANIAASVLYIAGFAKVIRLFYKIVANGGL